MKSLSPVQLLVTSWSAAHQAPPSMGFSRQEYWSGVPSPSSEMQRRPNYLKSIYKEFVINGKKFKASVENLLLTKLKKNYW